MSNKGDYSELVEVDDDLLPPTPQLEFQDFSMDGASTATITGTISPGPRSNSSLNSANQGPNSFAPPSNAPSTGSWFGIAYFAQFFDVDTMEVVGRLQHSLLFVTNQDRFIDSLSEKPDLYGPFWLASSVACVIFAVSSLLETVRASLLESKIAYDFNQIWTSLLTVYCYTFGVPLLFYVVLRYLGANPVLLELIGVYGYGLISWIPVVILCGIPNNVVRWLMVTAGAGYSGFFLARNVYPIFKRTDSSVSRTGLILAVALAHLGFALILKLQYLSYEFSVTPAPEPAKPTS